MKNTIFLILVIILFSCKEKTSETSLLLATGKTSAKITIDYTMVFASCNDQDMEQPLWKPIIELHPDVFIWGGDNIYADTDDMVKMKADYGKISANPAYTKLASETKIIGTWDDHDYGKNDAGKEWQAKAAAQELFLDFIKVPKDDVRRTREGVYTSEIFSTKKGSIKVILLDTRYFRDSLQKSKREGVRYDPWKKGEGGTILGNAQWQWLQEELNDSRPTFTVIISSIQFLANEHNWEKWANFPDEVEKMYEILKTAKAKNVLILSGDRHLAEFSVTEVEGLPYTLVDFTTSGLTKTYPDSPEDVNKYRVGNQVKQLNFGLLLFDFDNKTITMEIRGADNKIYDTLVQEY